MRKPQCTSCILDPNGTKLVHKNLPNPGSFAGMEVRFVINGYSL